MHRCLANFCRLVALVWLTVPAARAAQPQWASAWTVAQGDRLTAPAMSGTSVRVIVRPTVSGHSIRVLLQNAMGQSPVTFAAAYIGRVLSGASVSGTNTRLTFNGQNGVTLAPGASAYSDAAAFPVSAFETYAITLEVTSASDISVHRLGLVTNYSASAGHASDPSGTAFSPVPNGDDGGPEGPTYPVYWVAALDVDLTSTAGTVVALGDSITDGECSTRTNSGAGSGVVTPDQYNRWTDILASRLSVLPANQSKAIANEGIAGNRVVSGGSGPPAVSRLDRDVLSRPGATHVIFLEGTNDIANGASAVSIETSDQQIIDRAHAAGLQILGATIIPRGGSNGWTSAMEQQRLALNDWIRHQANFDGLIDFDALMQGTLNPANNAMQIRSGWSCFDGIHPNSAGYQAMAEFIDLALLQRNVQGAPAPSLTWIPGSTKKIEQLIGDTDYQTKQPTLSQSNARFKVAGTDLGYNFEHRDELVFLFGDSLYFNAGDTMARITGGDPETGLTLDFFTKSGGSALLVQPPGVSMGAFEVPDSGISIAGQAYVVCKTDHSSDANNPTDASVLTRFDDSANTFTVVRQISKLPSGKFIEIAMHEVPAGMVAPQPSIVMWGSGVYRGSDVYLATVPSNAFESGAGTQYFTGTANGQPQWSSQEAAAAAVVSDGTIGNVSVTWAPQAGLWLMTYDSRNPANKGIVFRYAPQPWGPWSAPQVIFDPKRDGGLGKFIHDPSIVPDDGLDGPTIGGSDPHTTPGGDYAPYVLERFTRVEGNVLSIYYTMSTWNPYTVVLMRSQFTIAGIATGPPPKRRAVGPH